ncbi:hypothetical protein [Sphingobium subterraneum]|uniref:Lipoprotein n=1 Tax=Sphingobium subterraneum TaxID=627688 RepID=A0A841J1I5_9SPHN|nr:hypothetical protein [Sphingobium subterraneum]MBB6124564.1 hypothetical protein [Sphingobium subterraneum]
MKGIETFGTRGVALGVLGACALALSGCGETGPGPASASTRTQVMASQYGAAPAPLMGLDARKLVALFGAPRLDIRDRTVRKLQFTTGRCVIDTYLYAPAKGKEPQVTHVDSRLPTGEDVELAKCEVPGK